MIKIKETPRKGLIELLYSDIKDILNEYQGRGIENGILLDHLEDTINRIINPTYQTKF